MSSGGASGEVRVWDASSRELVAHLKHHGQPITDVKVGATGWLTRMRDLCNICGPAGARGLKLSLGFACG